MTEASRTSGGSAAAGGFDFQAALGAIAYIHTLRGTPIDWTEDWTASPPAAVSFETAGPGDDISLMLADGRVVEVQAKKGLRASEQFWSALESLCEGVNSDCCDYGILAVCPQSSRSIRVRYEVAIRRLGEQRDDDPSPEQTRLAGFLTERGYDIPKVCSRIRIKTVSALINDTGAVAAARSELGHVCVRADQTRSAWNALFRDAMSAISTRGRRTRDNLIAVLRTSRIDLSEPSNGSPVSTCTAILEWTKSRTEHFDILGMRDPMPTDEAWLPLKAFVHSGYIETGSSAQEALVAYHAIGDESTRRLEDKIDARTIGTFRNLCVVIGGPGSGKSLLLEVLARDFAKDSFVSLRIRLRDLAKRMERYGCTVEEGIFELALDGSGISPEQLRAARLSELVILCDGLDECGDRQPIIASGLRSIATSHPSYRIVVTTRPIGYSTSELRSWRHYEIAPLASKDVPEHLETLCRCAAGTDAPSEEKLHERVKAHLEEGDSSRTLARTPLLLALGASLFLKWKRPSRSKSDLYDRIFKLIDDTLSPRKETQAAPTQAIRERVLNALGWHVVASPLLTADEIERRCAEGLQAAMGTAYLQAQSDVQQSIKYWEATGLIERLRHTDLELIAFVHKTCGEFAAARHLAAMHPDQARSVIRSELANPDSEEILDFATQTPLATTLAEMLMVEFEAAEPNLDTLNRLFRILARPETSLSRTDRRAFLERVFALARSPDRQRAYRAGLCLTNNDLRRLPEAEEMASRLLLTQAEWSRLVGWAVLASHFPNNLERGALEKAFHHFLGRSREDDFFVVEGKPLFGLLHLRDRGVFENFLIGALRCLLTDKDEQYQDRLIDVVTDSQNAHTVGFSSRFSSLLTELGRRDAARQHPRWGRLISPIDFARIQEASLRDATVLRDVVSRAFLKEPAGPPPQTGLKFLSAFLRMSGMLKSSATDVYASTSSEENRSEVHALFRAAASVFSIPAERLAAEAKHAVEVIDALKEKGESYSVLSVFPDVDPPDTGWERAGEVNIDIGLLETLVHHPSGWVGRLAALLLDGQLKDAQRASVCRRILTQGKGDTLHWGAALAAELPDHGARELILHRLEGRPVEGFHHLFNMLCEDQLILVPAHLRVLENGMFNSDAETAAAAAQWCRTVAKSSDVWLVPLLVRAMDYWLEQEDRPGSSADSPRGNLLRTLYSINGLDRHQLVELAADRRSDVKNSAIDCLVVDAIESTEQRRELVDMICAKRFPVGICDRLLDMKIPYAAAELSRLGVLRNDADPAFRVFVVRCVFTHPEMDPAEAASNAVLMKGDQNGNVRDAVYQFLDSAARGT